MQRKTISDIVKERILLSINQFWLLYYYKRHIFREGFQWENDCFIGCCTKLSSCARKTLKKLHFVKDANSIYFKDYLFSPSPLHAHNINSQPFDQLRNLKISFIVYPCLQVFILIIFLHIHSRTMQLIMQGKKKLQVTIIGLVVVA